MFGDTIAAIATAWGTGGIAIVRLSGPDSWAIAQRRVKLKSLAALRPRVARNALFLDEDGEAIDEILLLPFHGPQSYTGEDVVEFQCHGGSLIASRCLELLLADGARMALPGEFTRRAFENGRLDLSQAEAVAALIQARSNAALHSASRTLSGELTRETQRIYDKLTVLGAEIEVGLDFPEEDVPYLEDASVLEGFASLRQDVNDLLERCSSGFILREGITVVLLGRPNAGKSSLMNALLKEQRSIVTPIPGTTRDIIEATLTCRGVPLRLLDTAGIADSEQVHDEVEAIGVEKALSALEKADVRLWLIDGSAELAQEDVDRVRSVANMPHVIVLTKADLPQRLSPEMLAQLLPQSPVISVSSQYGDGLEALKERIVSLLDGTGALDSGLNASSRQIDELRQCALCLLEGENAMRDGLQQATAAVCLADAMACLSRLIGGDHSEDLLHAVFSRFCIGK